MAHDPVVTTDPKIDWLDPEIRWQVEFLRSLEPMGRRRRRYECLVRMDPPYAHALRLALNAQYLSGHETLSNLELLSNDSHRPIYLAYLLGLCMGALDFHGLAPLRARKLLAAVLWLNLGLSGRAARSYAAAGALNLARGSLALARERGWRAVRVLVADAKSSDWPSNDLTELLPSAC